MVFIKQDETEISTNNSTLSDEHIRINDLPKQMIKNVIRFPVRGISIHDSMKTNRCNRGDPQEATKTNIGRGHRAFQPLVAN